MSKIFSTLMTIVVVTTTIDDMIDGMMTLQKICSSVAPSIRAASSRSSGTALIAADRMTMAKPVWSQIMITIRNRLFHGSHESHAFGSPPRLIKIPLRRPICSPKPSGRKL